MNTAILLVFVAAAAGCTPALAGPTAVSDPTAPPIAQTSAATGPVGRGSNVVVEEAVGTDGGRARAAAARVRSRIDECQLGDAGVVHARLSRDPEGDGIRVSIRRGRPLRSAERDCVMAALQSVEVDDLQSQSSPSNRPLDTYVLLRVEW